MRSTSLVLVFALLGLAAGCSNRQHTGGGFPAPDASTDGVDAGPGVEDGGGSSDAGAADAGSMSDAGAADAGSASDAGAMDAGSTSDAGPPDAGTVACPGDDLGGALGDSIATGSTAGAADAVAPSCGSGGGPDATFLWTAPSAGTFTFVTNGSGFDTVLSIRSGDGCTGAELACNDDGGEGSRSRASATLASGDAVVLVVEGFSGATGDFVLSAYEGVPDTETACTDGADDDVDGDVDCDDYDCDSDPACTETACADGADDDGDGYTDCDDSDCYGDPACTETECTNGADDDGDGDTDCEDYDCDSDPACIETDCADGADDDGDGEVDCLDYDCYGEAACGEAGMCDSGSDDDGDGRADCADSECTCDAACLGSDPCPGSTLGGVTGTGVATGSNVGLCGFRTGSCGGDGAEITFEWTAPSGGTYTFDTIGTTYDTVLYVLDGTCGGTELGCNDDGTSGLTSEVTVTLTAGQTVIVVVDAYAEYEAGAAVLNIAGP